MQGASKLNMNPAKPEQPSSGLKRQVVYMPSCVTRMMGPSLSDTERQSVHEKMLSIFDKAGYEVIYPEVRFSETYDHLHIQCRSGLKVAGSAEMCLKKILRALHKPVSRSNPALVTWCCRYCFEVV